MEKLEIQKRSQLFSEKFKSLILKKNKHESRNIQIKEDKNSVTSNEKEKEDLKKKENSIKKIKGN